MIKISGFIHQFDVRKTQKKADDKQAILITNRNKKSGKAA